MAVEFSPRDIVPVSPLNVGEKLAPSESSAAKAERRSKRWARTKEWTKTVRNAAVLETLPHLAGAGTVLVDRLVFDKLGTTPEIGATALAINAAMWAIMYGPNTRKNVNMLEDSEQSIAIAAKAVHQWAEGKNKDEGTRVKLARRAHRLELTAWEAVYGAEAALLGMSVDSNMALKYWGGAGALGLVKNVALWGGFEARERRKASKMAKTDAIAMIAGEEIAPNSTEKPKHRHIHFPKSA